MKIAFPTNDGEKISAHFGRATHFLVVTVENGAETHRELREKAHHGASNQPHTHGHNHGGMVSPLADCQVLIAGGMGIPAAQAVERAGVQLIPTGIQTINAALAAFLQDNLTPEPSRIHAPGHHAH